MTTEDRLADVQQEAEQAWVAECLKHELPPDTTFYFRIGQKRDWMNGWEAAMASRWDHMAELCPTCGSPPRPQKESQ